MEHNVLSLLENAVTVFGHRLYNSLRNYRRDMRNFIFELEKFIKLIPDEPKLTNYITAARSNTILDLLTHRSLGSRNRQSTVTRVSNSAAEQA